MSAMLPPACCPPFSVGCPILAEADDAVNELASMDMLSDLVMMSAPLGLVVGIAECGKMFGLMGLISMCSVQVVSNIGFFNRSTSTFRLRCSNGQENVSPGMLWSQDRRLRSESLKSDWLRRWVKVMLSAAALAAPELDADPDPVAFC